MSSAHSRRPGGPAGSSSSAGISASGSGSGSGSRAVLDKSEPIVRRRVTPTPSQQQVHQQQQPQTERAKGKQPMGSFALNVGSSEGLGEIESDDGGKGLQKPSRPRGHGEGAYNPAAAGTSAGINSFMNDFDAYAKKTQDRLEAWFGIADSSASSSSSSRAISSRTAHSSQGTAVSSQQASSISSPPQNLSRPGGEVDDVNNDTSLVYIHHVQLSDTVASLSLQYGIEPSLLRRVNKLWAGDKPQMRGQIYIPVDACRTLQSRPGSAKGKGAGSSASPTSSAEEELHSDYLQSQGSGRKSSVKGVAYGFWNEERGLVRKLDSGETSSVNVQAPTPLQEGHLRMHDRAISTSSAASAGPGARSAASVSARSRASSGAGSRMTATSGIPGSMQRVPKQELRFFSPGNSATGGMNGNHYQHDHTSSGSSTASWAGKTGYGQSGLDDLLQISHERALAAANGGQAKGKASATDADDSTLTLSGRTFRQQDSEEVLSSDNGAGGEGAEDGRSDAGTSYSDRLGGDDNWKPNKWTLGQRKKSMSSLPLSRTLSDQGSQPTSANHIATVTGLRPLQLVQSNFPNGPPDAGLERASLGWNDVPPSGANVALAYSSKRSAKNSKAHHRLLNDLAAGLPPNPGPASSWQRPIGASLPPPPPGTAAARTGALASNEARASASAGFGKLFNDAFRGRISVEGALEAVMDQVTGKAGPDSAEGRNAGSAGSARRRDNASMPTLPPNRPDLRSHDTGSLGRVSAEEARASLSMGRTLKHDPNGEGRQANGVPMDHISLSLGATQDATGPRRVRSRAGLKDVEWHRE